MNMSAAKTCSLDTLWAAQASSRRGGVDCDYFIMRVSTPVSKVTQAFTESLAWKLFDIALKTTNTHHIKLNSIKMAVTLLERHNYDS